MQNAMRCRQPLLSRSARHTWLLPLVGSCSVSWCSTIIMYEIPCRRSDHIAEVCLCMVINLRMGVASYM